MSTAIPPTTLSITARALDIAEIRQAVHAHNIANSSVPGYTAKVASFSGMLDAADGELGVLQPRPTLQESGRPVEIYSELANMSENLVHYQSLVKLLNRHYVIASMAINDGKR